MYGKILTSNVSVRYGNLKYPIEKSFFAVNLPLIFFRATVANANTESVKAFHTLFGTYLDYMLEKWEQNRTVQTWRFWTKSSFKTIFDKALTPFSKTFLWLKQ